MRKSIYFVCLIDQTKSEIFAPTTGGAEKMCSEMNVKFLGDIPLDPNLLKICESGKSFFKDTDKQNSTHQSFLKFVESMSQTDIFWQLF